MHDAGWRKTVPLWELTTALGLDMSVYGQYKLEKASLFQISYYLFTPWGVDRPIHWPLFVLGRNPKRGQCIGLGC